MGLVHSHNTTQASIAQQVKLCSIADAARVLGYHNSPIGQESVYSSNSFNPPMTIGAVQASPLTVANVYATLGADGVACDPIAIKRVVDKNGKRLKVPSAHCHQAIPKGIAQTVAYALNQGVVRPDGMAHTAQLDGGRKTFAKTGTNERFYMTTAGFVPHQIASFVAIGNAESQKSFNGATINGRTMAAWYGVLIATPAWKQFMNDYLKAANIPIDNDYGNPDPKYTAGGTVKDARKDTAEKTDQQKRDEDARRQAMREQEESQNQQSQQQQQQTQDQYGTARRDDYNNYSGDNAY